MSINNMIFNEMRKNSGVIMIESPDLKLFASIDNLIKEWRFWLSYINSDAAKELERIVAKKAAKITKKEREYLNRYQEELELLQILKKYPKKKWNAEDYELIDKYLTTSIEALILTKLTEVEQEEAKAIFQNINNEPEEKIHDCLTTLENSTKPVNRYVKFLLLKRQYRVGIQKLNANLQAEYKRNLAIDNRKQHLGLDKWSFIK